jgi:hypothetical protein
MIWLRETMGFGGKRIPATTASHRGFDAATKRRLHGKKVVDRARKRLKKR